MWRTQKIENTFNSECHKLCADEFSDVLFGVAARKGGNFYLAEQGTFLADLHIL